VARKLKRAVEVGQIKSGLHSLIFMIVYLLYPGVSRAVFGMLTCRALSDGVEVLEADYRILCYIEGGEAESTYRAFKIMAIITVFFIPFGIPLYFGYFLHKNRDYVKANPKYVALVGLRPLFMFYKRNCYMWEVYFMLQKVVLVGVMVSVCRFCPVAKDRTVALAVPQAFPHPLGTTTDPRLVPMNRVSSRSRRSSSQLTFSSQSSCCAHCAAQCRP
jgi:hypothetical protein